MTPQELLDQPLDPRELSALLDKFEVREESYFDGFEMVRRFAQQLATRPEENLRVADILSLAAEFKVPSSVEFVGDKHPLEELSVEFALEKWKELIKEVPPGDRLNALAMLCSAGGLFSGQLSAPVFAAIVIAVLVVRGVHEMVT